MGLNDRLEATLFTGWFCFFLILLTLMLQFCAGPSKGEGVGFRGYMILATAGLILLIFGIIKYLNLSVGYAVNSDGLTVRNKGRETVYFWSDFIDYELLCRDIGLVLHCRDGRELAFPVKLKGYRDLVSAIAENCPLLKDRDLDGQRVLIEYERNRHHKQLHYTIMNRIGIAALCIVIAGLLAWFILWLVPRWNYYIKDLDAQVISLNSREVNGDENVYAVADWYKRYTPYLPVPFICLLCAGASLLLRNMVYGDKKVYRFKLRRNSDYCSIGMLDAIGFMSAPAPQALTAAAWPEKHAGRAMVLFTDDYGRTRNYVAVKRLLNGRQIKYQEITIGSGVFSAILDVENATTFIKSLDYASQIKICYLVLPECADAEPKQWVSEHIKKPAKSDCANSDVIFYSRPMAAGDFSPDEFPDAVDRLLATALRNFCCLAPPESLTAKSLSEQFGINSFPDEFMIGFQQTGGTLRIYLRDCHRHRCSVISYRGGYCDIVHDQKLPGFMKKHNVLVSLGYFIFGPLLLVGWLFYGIIWVIANFEQKVMSRGGEYDV